MADPLALAQAADRLQPLALARLEELVTAESPTGDPIRLGRINEQLQAAFTEAGARVDRVPGSVADHLVCEWSGTGLEPSAGHVLFVGHSDTVFSAGTLASRPFTVAGDTVTGPGVFDMKGGLVALELAMRLVASDSRLRRPVRLVVVNDEEDGSPDGQRVIAEHTTGAACAIGLEPPLPGGALKVGRRGVARYRVRVQGIEAHAGLDAKDGVSAIDELVDQLTSLRSALPDSPDLAVNVGEIDGGTRANVIAAQASALLGVRFATAEAESTIVAALNGLAARRSGATVTSAVLSRRPAWPAAEDNPVVAQLRTIAAAMGYELGVGVSGGAGDTNAIGAAGIPTVDGLGPEGGGAHAATEWASISSLLSRAVLLATYLG